VFQAALALPHALDFAREKNDVDAILRLQGSKRTIAQWIVSHMPRHTLFVDVFGGTGALVGAKNPSRAEVYNDAHKGIVNVWRVLRERPEALKAALLSTPYARVAWEEAKEGDCPQDPVEWARRILVRSWQGYGGDWQKPSNGWRGGASIIESRTTPIEDWEALLFRLEAWQQRMRGVALECMDALDLIKRYDHKEALFYCDPPYLGTANNYDHNYSERDHHALAQALRGIKGKAMISGYDTPLYRELYEGWSCVKTTTRANRGVSREEVLWLCPKTTEERAWRLL
jgi:DNA adenine methylase